MKGEDWEARDRRKEKGGRTMEMSGNKESTLTSRFKGMVYFYVGTECNLLIGHIPMWFDQSEAIV